MFELHSCANDSAAIILPLLIGDGPLTVAIKDSIDIAGLPTRQGSAVFANVAAASSHADVIARLLQDGGWRIIGKTAMHELAFGVTGLNPFFGTPLNPLWPDRIPGGSSSGSAAAVAGGLCDVALGSDTGGSVRLPATCCGIIGLKPTFGLVSRKGVHPANSSLDCVGPFARTVSMIERSMAAISPGFVAQSAVADLRIGVVASSCDIEIDVAVSKALGCSGGLLSDVTLALLNAAYDAGIVIIGAENWRAMSALVDLPGLGEDVRARLCAGSQVDEAATAEAEKVRVNFTAEVDNALRYVDVLALPTLPIIPPTLEEAADARAIVPLTRLVRPFNLSGHPAITLPLRTTRGLPAGLQLIGRRGGDAELCAAARILSIRLGIEEANI